jgi:hypothetical protein
MGIIYAGIAGGIYAFLGFVHFAVDFITQNQADAIAKHDHTMIRARHCLIYTLAFLPMFYLFGLSCIEWLIGIAVLFGSHFYLDTYHLVALWARYVRRAPEMIDPIFDPKTDKIHLPSLKEGFKRYNKTPVGLFLSITLDQISHLYVLWIIVFMAMRHL